MDRGENPDAFLKHQLDQAKSMSEALKEKVKALKVLAGDVKEGSEGATAGAAKS